MIETINVLIIGSGLYVTGKGTDSLGVIMPTVADLQKNGIVSKIIILVRNKYNIEEIQNKINDLSNLINHRIRVEFLFGDVSDENYKQLVSKLDSTFISIVAIPDHLHYAATKPLLESKINTLVVKPFTVTTQEAYELINIAKQNKLWTGVEYHKRYDQANRILKRYIDENKLGQISNILIEYSQRKIVPIKYFKSWVEHTNIFQYLGVHYVDMIYYLTKYLPKRVMAVGSTNSLSKVGIDNYDTIHAIIEWGDDLGNSFNSSHLTSWIDPQKSTAESHQSIKIIGTDGIFESDQKYRGIEYITDEGVEHINPYFAKLYKDVNNDYYIDGYGPQCISQFIRDCLNHLNGKKVMSICSNFSEATISVAVSESVKESLGNCSRWVDVTSTSKIKGL